MANRVLPLLLLLLVPTGAQVDREYAEDAGLFMGEFFHDSQSQLTVDLDLMREIWSEVEKFGGSAAAGDVDHIQAVIDFLRPLLSKAPDVSAPCVSDIFHFLYTTYHYADTARAASLCRDCNCTASYRHSFQQYQWIFNGGRG